MGKVKPGSFVTLIYDGLLDNGELFESSADTGPLELIIGAGQVMPEFEKNIIGMAQGESKTFTLPPEAGHGKHNPELVHTISRQALKDSDNVAVGMVLGLTMEKDGQSHQVPAMITAVADDKVTVDFNHPLAGKSLTYKVTVKSVKNE